MDTIRQANPSDKYKILNLYKRVAEKTMGIARTESEIDENYVQSFMDNSRDTGIELVIDGNSDSKEIIAEIHCYKLGPKVFSHVFSELTIVIDPDCQGKGIGNSIFTHLLDFISANRPDILRVELIARESNQKAINFYKKLGFTVEGRFKNRITSNEGSFEADIPMAWFNKNYSV
jgi:ribosomal protein S18 acetylase RimI-like enzyme